jgi:hypothetical protein
MEAANMSSVRHHPLMFLPIALSWIAILAWPAGAQAECSLTGHIEAVMDPSHADLGLWRYTMTVTWDTGTRLGLSHFNLWLDETDQNCSCAEIDAALAWEEPVGSSTGEPHPCTVPFRGMLECKGDSSLGIDGIIIKFEPIGGGDCEPGPQGEAVVTFYSDYAPASIALPNMYLMDKHGRLSCFGQVTGVFPGLPCDPTPIELQTWGGIKAIYRH